MNYPFCFEKVGVALYDISIEDLEQRRKQRLEFTSITKAANYLGYLPQTLNERIKFKHKVTHRTSGKVYAARTLNTTKQ